MMAACGLFNRRKIFQSRQDQVGFMIQQPMGTLLHE
jgi:hypothetical protein